MDEIYKKYSLLVYRYLYRLTGDNELSEELMQETFYSATKSIKKFKGNSKISVWLCQIAKNKWRYYLKKNKKANLISLDNYNNTLLYNEELFEQISDKEEVMCLYQSINKLDEASREVFYLRMKGNLTFKEIANIVGKTESWVKITFYRGKLKIKEDLLKNEGRL